MSLNNGLFNFRVLHSLYAKLHTNKHILSANMNDILTALKENNIMCMQSTPPQRRNEHEM